MIRKIVIIILCLFCVVGCSNDKRENIEDVLYDKSFGSYVVPSNWVESSKYSSNDKFFYILEGEEKKEQFNNISINQGTNKYAKEDHESFRKAILAQLSAQVATLDVEIKANGSTTDNGDVLYTFIIDDGNMLTTQYYIVGDYEYILVHETVYGVSSVTDEIAIKMVNSFKWKE